GSLMCYVIDACSRIRDYDRAAQWCERMYEACERLNIAGMYLLCRPNYAQVLIWRGSWPEAESELTIAADQFRASAPPMAAESIARLAELRCRQGRLDEAEALLVEVESDPLSYLARAELACERGDLRA